MTLDDYDLTDGQAVRYHRGPGHKWRQGVVNGVNADGSLNVVDDYTGNVRALRLETWELEARVRGPRGGRNWQPVTRQHREESA